MKGRILRFDYPRSKTRTDIHVALYERSLKRFWKKTHLREYLPKKVFCKVLSVLRIFVEDTRAESECTAEASGVFHDQ